MKAVLQRVSSAKVTSGGQVLGEIGQGLAVLLGVVAGDGVDEADFLAEKAAGLRIFEDENGKMNRSLLEVGLCLQPGSAQGEGCRVPLTCQPWSVALEGLG